MLPAYSPDGKRLADSIGAVGTVYITLPASKASGGQVTVNFRNRQETFAALNTANRPVPSGEKIKILAVVDGATVLVGGFAGAGEFAEYSTSGSAPGRVFNLYFRSRLHDPLLAEDVVHDVFEAVLSGRAAFAGRCALRSWLTAILKHKIVDLVRQRAGTDSLDIDDEDGPALSLACPQAGPDEVAEQRQRLARTLACIDALPPALRDVLRLRVLEDAPTGQVCAALAISEENLFVRLHRARKALALAL